MMTRERKAKEISDLTEKFGQAKAAFLVDYKGLNVEQVTNLRKTLSPLESNIKVVRNTLARRALLDHPAIEQALGPSLTGTNAVVFAYGDVGASAKAVAEFGKDHEELQLKAGVMGDKALSEDQIKYLATLPPKEVLQGQLLAVLSAPMTKFLGTLEAAPAGMLRLLNAYKDSKNEG